MPGASESDIHNRRRCDATARQRVFALGDLLRLGGPIMPNWKGMKFRPAFD
jgi:hypothetical protein